MSHPAQFNNVCVLLNRLGYQKVGTLSRMARIVEGHPPAYWEWVAYIRGQE